MQVLFICEGNMMRSQMAEAFYNDLSDSHDAVSAGAVAEIKDHVSKRAINAMGQIGFDITNLRPKQLTQELVDTADRVIYFPSEYMPDYVKQNLKAELWDVIDPHYHHEQGMDLVHKVRDDIKNRVETLMKENKHG